MLPMLSRLNLNLDIEVLTRYDKGCHGIPNKLAAHATENGGTK
jgi:hypothetical protein